MQALVLLIGYLASAVTLALGYNLAPLAFVALTVATILALREYDRRRS